MIRGFENNLDEMKAIDYLDSLDKRILMTREEGKLTQMVIDYKKIINKALKLLDSYKLGKYDYALTPAGLLELEDILEVKKMKINKKYYQQLIEEMARELLKEKNKLAQIFDDNIKRYKTHSIGYNTDDLDIVITIKKRKY